MSLILISKIVFISSIILQVILCIFFYNNAGLDVLLWAGWILFPFGLILFVLPAFALGKKGGVPAGKDILHTTVLVDGGLYGVVRHPSYLGSLLIILGLTLISQHLLSVVIVILNTVLIYVATFEEEKYLLKKFGNDYKRYMDRVPMMNLFLGLIRMVRKR